jgi:hypothetical protein
LGVESAIATVAWVVLAVWTERLHGLHHVESLLEGIRAAVYGALAAIDATLLGFIIATAAIVLGFADSERFVLLRESKQYATLWRVFTSTIRVLAVATLASLAALFLDKENPHTSAPAMLVCALLLALTIVKVARSIWAFEQVILIATARPEQG